MPRRSSPTVQTVLVTHKADIATIGLACAEFADALEVGGVKGPYCNYLCAEECLLFTQPDGTPTPLKTKDDRVQRCAACVFESVQVPARRGAKS
jgi:hypothetical protein